MPVYGKGRTNRKNLTQTMVDRGWIERVAGKRVVRRTKLYDIEKTKLKTIERRSGFEIRSFIQKRLKAGGFSKKNPFVVWDWGAGRATAARKIARLFKGNVAVYGTSDLAYQSWAKVKNVKLIHATAEDSLRYFKPESVDLIYSHQALHVLGGGLQSYGEQLLTKLRLGGKLVIVPFNPRRIPTNFQEFTVNGKIFKGETISGKLPAIVVTRVK
jgi:SAM-dependent methyltransferase